MLSDYLWQNNREASNPGKAKEMAGWKVQVEDSTEVVAHAPCQVGESQAGKGTLIDPT